MTDAETFSPLWGEWYLKEMIGQGTFGAVYKAEKTEYGNTYVSAIKHLSIPPKNVNKASLAAEGIATDERSLHQYCDTMRDQIIREINFCYSLRGNTNIVAYEDHCILPKKSEIGYDIFIRMELLTPLTQYMTEHPLTEQTVIQLGLSMCEALELLNRKHMIHRDIKPANIFVNDMGIYKLGDFGESKVLNNNSMGMTVRGTYSYMSPEISKGAAADITADIYSLGLVMYRLLNGNRAPFLPVTQPTVTSAEIEQSNVRRLRGEPLPPPAFCNNQALTAVVLKACSFYPQERWHTPQEMKEALETLCSGRAAYPLPVPPAYRQEPSGYSVYGTAFQPPSIHPPFVPAQPVPAKKKLPLIIGSIVGAAAIIGIVVMIILVSGANRNHPPTTTPQNSTPVSQPSTVTSQPSSVTSQPSTVISEPSVITSHTSADGMSVREFFASSAGQAFQKFYTEQAEKQIEEQFSGVLTFRMYTEGEDVLVYEYQYLFIDSMTDSQKELMKSQLEQSSESLKSEMKLFMSQYGIRSYQTLYRYKGSSGKVLVELLVTL